MKHYYALSFLFVFSISYAQTGSGTITLNTGDSQQLNYTVTAKDLFSAPGSENTYTINGITGQAVTFGPWALDATASVSDFLQTEHNLVIYNNISGIDAVLTVNDPSLVKARIFDTYGRYVGSPQVINHGHKVQLYADLGDKAAGIYFVQVATDKGYGAFKAINTGSEAKRLVVVNSAKSQAVTIHRKAGLAGENYSISIPDTYDYPLQSFDIIVNEGSSNQFNIPIITKSGDLIVFGTQNNNPQGHIIAKITTSSGTSTVSSGDDIAAVFEDLHLDNQTEPITISISSELGLWPETTFQSTMSWSRNFDTNQPFIGEVDDLSTTKDITFKIENLYSLNSESGASVELIDNNTDTVIGTVTTDSDGYATISGVSAGQYIISVDKAGDYYKVFYRTIDIVAPTTIYELADTLRFTTAPFARYDDNTPLTATRVNNYLDGYHVNGPALEGKANVYAPSTVNPDDRTFFLGQTDALTDDLGLPRVNFTTSSLQVPDGNTTYVPNSGQTISWGSDMEWNGTSSAWVNKTINNVMFTLASNPFKTSNNVILYLHEWMRWAGFKDNSGFPTSTNPTVGQTVNYFNSADDQAGAPYVIKFANNFMNNGIYTMADHVEE